MTSPNPEPPEPEIPKEADQFLEELNKMRDQSVELQRAQVDVLCDISEYMKKLQYDFAEYLLLTIRKG